MPVDNSALQGSIMRQFWSQTRCRLGWTFLMNVFLLGSFVPSDVGKGVLGQEIIQVNGAFDKVYLVVVNNSVQNIFAFNHTVSRDKTEGVRVHVNVLSEQAKNPVLFVIRQQKAVVSFQAPLMLRGLYQRKYIYQDVSRTLCQPEVKSELKMQYFYVDVSTLSEKNASVQLYVKRIQHFVLRTAEPFRFNATPSQPQRKDFRNSSFYVVVVVKTEDEACGGALPFYPLKEDEPMGLGNRTKILNVTVVPAVNSVAYVNGVLFSLGIFLAFYLLTLLIACWEHRRQQRKRERLLGKNISSPDQCAGGYTPQSPDLYTGSSACQSYGSFENGSVLGSEAVTDSMESDSTCGYMEKPLDNVIRPRLDSLSSIEEDEYDTLADIDSDKNVIRTKKFLYVSDLARKDKRVLSKKYKIYFWNIATIAVFYALPVIQLVITYQTVFNITGNQDICYYNFLCAHPLGVLSAFNNILSNLGYLMLGLLFLLIVLQREILHKRALMRNDVYALECGIPKHFGLFYAMGTALMMEGLLSACYHVCPNYTNFQFDTSFMYMIAGLCMLKLYQKRHPDINASAYSAYASLALVIFISVLGVVFGKDYIVFWAVFSFIHILSTLLLSIQLYYVGRWKLDAGIFRRIIHVIYTDHVRQCSGPAYIDRMVLLIMGNIVNWSLAAYGLILRPKDFASYLLAIGICNLLLYFAFYIIMKLRSGERIRPIPLICIICTAVVWGFALFFFFQGLSTWQKTPAESREHNRECILLQFFDDHDIWHFLSSIALFGSFLILLTLDEDLDDVPRDKIYVF
ncbi:SID1 transmembrane family member 2 isoform X4 [Hemitrygon akajei]|uniref:SID1 transmembrane family member 2 isoform X4 n=1 Tax=Hemitrygon akajei TaxID=2704970 RepID=UPI003BFA298E